MTYPYYMLRPFTSGREVAQIREHSDATDGDQRLAVHQNGYEYGDHTQRTMTQEPANQYNACVSINIHTNT